jgi:hypothetical protein
MTTDSRDQPKPATADEFQRQLTQLLHTAVDNEIDVQGGWTCRSASIDTDWAIEIIKLAPDR